MTKPELLLKRRHFRLQILLKRTILVVPKPQNMAEVNQEQVQVEEKNAVGFYERLTALPVVSEAINQTGAIYNAVKGHNGLTQYACDTGESVVKRVTATAYTVGTPIAGLAMKVAEPYVGNPGQYFTFI